jgi:exopolysaccharide biosynthesis protein
VNLDGGGSTTMSVRGVLANHPSDPTGERSVGDALVYVP